MARRDYAQDRGLFNFFLFSFLNLFMFQMKTIKILQRPSNHFSLNFVKRTKVVRNSSNMQANSLALPIVNKYAISSTIYELKL